MRLFCWLLKSSNRPSSPVLPGLLDFIIKPHSECGADKILSNSPVQSAAYRSVTSLLSSVVVSAALFESFFSTSALPDNVPAHQSDSSPSFITIPSAAP